MDTNPQDAAFPLVVCSDGDVESGLSKREYFAAIALQGLLAAGNSVTVLMADRAVAAADALIEALNDGRSPHSENSQGR